MSVLSLLPLFGKETVTSFVWYALLLFGKETVTSKEGHIDQHAKLYAQQL
jgi:hypothetical protein